MTLTLRLLQGIFFLVLFLTLPKTGHGLKCYECDNYSNIFTCIDPFKPELSSRFLKECPRIDHLTGKPTNFTVCKKTFQELESDNFFYSRSCAARESAEDCFLTPGRKNQSAYVCQCTTNGCNAAAVWVPGSFYCYVIMATLVSAFGLCFQ